MKQWFERAYWLKLAAIVGFVLGQCFAVVHASQHELAADDPGCQICALAHAGGGTPATVATAPQLFVCSEAPPLPVIERITLRPITRPNSRGPPALLA